MITPTTINEGLPSETVEWTGKVEEGDVFHGLCCPGHDARVVVVIIGVWMHCENPDCPIGKGGMFHGEFRRDEEEIALWMLDQKEKNGSKGF